MGFLWSVWVSNDPVGNTGPLSHLWLHIGGGISRDPVACAESASQPRKLQDSASRQLGQLEFVNTCMHTFRRCSVGMYRPLLYGCFDGLLMVGVIWQPASGPLCTTGTIISYGLQTFCINLLVTHQWPGDKFGCVLSIFMCIPECKNKNSDIIY